jgi:hypothetical protein
MAVARGGPIRSPQDFAAGLSLVGLAAFALWHSAELDAGTLGQMGPGMLPKGLAILTGLLGLAIAATAFRWPGPALERWSVRAPLFILGSVVLFGLTARPLGLVVAGRLPVGVAGHRSARLSRRWAMLRAADGAVPGCSSARSACRSDRPWLPGR